MAKIHGNGQWGNNRPGRRQVYRFTSVVSPLGADAAETPNYSPASEVTGAHQAKGKPSQSESAKTERRGG